MKIVYTVVLTFMTIGIYSQNCEAYKYYGDTLKYKACIKTEESDQFYQFQKEYQEILDEAIEIDPTYSPAYRAKSIAYLKSGDFINWKLLIDKAVEYDELEVLGYRGWCRYQFFRDYKGAIKDIERLEEISQHDIGHSANGMYHLKIAKGLCYKAIGEKVKAIKIIEDQINENLKEDNFVGQYDYLHLGVLYLETEQYEKAIETLNKQIENSDIPEVYFYKALAFKALKNKVLYLQNLKLANDLFMNGGGMFDSYSNPMDKIFLSDLKKEISASKEE